MARVTDLYLLRFVSNFVLCPVHRVTRGTRDIVRGMHTIVPMDVAATRVAGQAGLALHFRGGLRFFAKNHIRRRWLVRAFVVHMLVAVAMATGTCWGTGVACHAMSRLTDREHGRMQIEHGGFGVICFVMTTGALGIPFEEQVGRWFGHIGRKGRARHQRQSQGTTAQAQRQDALDL